MCYYIITERNKTTTKIKGGNNMTTYELVKSISIEFAKDYAEVLEEVDMALDDILEKRYPVMREELSHEVVMEIMDTYLQEIL